MMPAWFTSAVAIQLLQGPTPVIEHGDRLDNRIAFTFDACSTEAPTEYDERIIKTLVDEHVPATIFVGGRWAQDEAPHVRELAANPLFEIGNHTWSHPHLSQLASEKEIRDEIERAQVELATITGAWPALFRPPFGEYDQRVVRVADGLGLRTVMFDVASGDPGKEVTKEALVRWVLHQAHAGSIIVMHINHLRFHTAEALPEIIAGLRTRGFTFVTVSALISPAHVASRDGPSPKEWAGGSSQHPPAPAAP
jgi:peptidoglycan/xylan/chitin deacetylase (PgdA/CDA1 family)